MKKTVDYYMSLPYQVEFAMQCDSDHPKYLAYIRELPPCRASVDASDSVEKLWRLLKENQRKWITRRLERGLEVPEPPDETLDPFWQEFPDEFAQHDIKHMLYEYGATLFPLDILETLWLGELENVRLREVEPSVGAPPKALTPHGDQASPTLRGDVRPVPLRGSLKKAWIKFDGPRTGRGYKAIEVLDQPLRTEAAIVATLTVLEASIIEDADFEWLREGLLEHVEARPVLRGKPLQEVLDELPARWFFDQSSRLNNDLAEKLEKDLETFSIKERDKERRKRYKAMRSWERLSIHWERSIRYMVALLRYRRPDFDQYPFEQQLDLLERCRSIIVLVGTILLLGDLAGVKPERRERRDVF